MSQKFLNPVEVNGQVSAEYLDLSTTTTHTAGVGELVWNDTDGTMDIGLKGGNVKLQVGQEQLARVVNKTSPLINLLESNYQVVVITGATGQRLSVKLAQGNNDANSAGTLGVVTETINANQEGFITISGQVREINTTGSLQGETWSDGDLLFLSATTPGAITNIRPIAPNHTVNIGYVEYAHAIHGKIYVKVDNGYELGELHDVDTSESKTTPIDADNLLLQDSADLSVWKKLSWSNTKATLKTYFDTLYQSVLTNPITGTGTTNYVSKFTGTTSLGNSQIFDNGTNVGIGTSSPSQKVQIGDGTGTGSQYLRISSSASEIYIGQSGGTILGLAGNSAQLILGDHPNFPLAIGTTNVQPLIFGTTNNERMRITSTGNVGIGTSSPATKFEVSGRALVDQFQYTRALNISSANLNDYTFAGFYNGEAMTNAPNSGWFWVTVERYSGDANWVHQTATSFGAGNTANEVYTRTNSGGTWTNWKRLIDWTDINGTTNYVSKFTGNNSIGNSSIYDNGTNVGIGTTSPNYRTQIETTGADVFLTKNTSSTSFNRSYFYNNNNVGVQFLNFGSAYGFGTEFGVGQNGSVIQSNTTSAFAVGTSGAYPLLLGTSGSERMRIDSSGNILVGQTSPIYSATNRANLTIGKSAGSILVLGTSTAANGYLFYNNTDLELANSTSSGSVFFRTSGTERMRITSGGNVGIGTSSPNSRLEVREANRVFDGYGNVNVFTTDTGTQNVGGSIALGGDSFGGTTPYPFAKIQGIKEGGGTWSGSLILGTTQSNSAITEKMRITSAGNVGIGTSSPSEKLEVQNGTSGAKIKVSNTGGGYASLECSSNATSVAQLSFTNQLSLIGGNVGIGTSSPSYPLEVNGAIVSKGGGIGDLDGTIGFGSPATSLSGNAVLGEMYFKTGGSEKMRINIAGNVGIGTSSPNFKLGIQASEPTFGILQAISNNNGGNATLGAKILFDVSGIGNFWEGMPSGANAWAVGLYNGSTNPEYMRITSAGNVGIGITTPDASALLDLKSTTQGFLPPRMNDTEMNNISSPVDGLMVFNTDVNTICVYISSAGGWKRLTYA